MSRATPRTTRTTRAQGRPHQLTEWADLLCHPWVEIMAVITAAERIIKIVEAGETACESATNEVMENTVVKSVETVVIVETDWVIDSGATHHLTPHRSILKSERAFETPGVFGLARGATVEAVEAGEVRGRTVGTTP